MAKAVSAFISYTRQGGAACAERLRTLLAANGIAVWQDRTHMIAGVDFWRQIETAVERCSHLLMVLTPDAFEGDRKILRQEWYTARKVGTCVVPVMGAPDMRADDDRLPHWLPAHHIYDPDRESDKLVAQVQSACQVERIPFMVDDLPDTFVPRTDEYEALLGLLLDERREGPVAITTALQGAGGFGKTTLAQGVCHDDRVIAAFKDGILWATLGEDRADVEQRIDRKLAALYAALTGDRSQFVAREDVLNELTGKLQFKRCLIVVDDVWDFADVKPFLRGAEGSARLITTRQKSIAVSAGAASVSVDEMKTNEAAALLAASMGAPEIGHATLLAVAARLGEWPILLNLFGGHVRECVGDGMTAVQAVEHLLQVLDEMGVTALDRESDTDRTHAVEQTLRISIARLRDDEHGALFDLAIFPEDIDVPLAVAGQLWRLTPTAAIERARRYANLGMVRLNLGAGTLGIHDVIRAYLAARHASLADAHRRMIAAWPDWRQLPHEYAWRWLPYHIVAADRRADLQDLLADFVWLQAKLDATDIGAVIADYDALSSDDPLRLIQDALRLAAYCLAGDPSQLASQLLGRLRPGADPAVDLLIGAAKQWRGRPWLRPLRPSLHAPGGPLVRVFRGYAGGHGGTIRSIAVDGHGRWAVSAGNSHRDQCVIVWNLRTGTHRRLDGQAVAGGYTPVDVAYHGGAFVTAFDKEIRVWQMADVTLLATLPCDARVTALAIAYDQSRILAGAADGSVICWNLETGAVTQSAAHAGAVDAVSIAANEPRAVSIGTSDAVIWDLRELKETHRWPTPGFRPHENARCLSMSTDGRYIAWGGHPQAVRSADGSASFWGAHSLMAWDTVSQRQIVLASHPGSDAVLCFSAPGQRAIVGHKYSEDDQGSAGLLVIDARGDRFVPLTEIGRGVSCAAITYDGRWAFTADYEHDLILWDLDRALQRGDAIEVGGPEWKGLRFDGFGEQGRWAVFGLEGKKPLVWDMATEAPARRTNKLRTTIRKLREQRKALGDEASKPPGSLRKTRRHGIWKVDVTFTVEGRLPQARGHSAAVSATAVAPNGRFDASVSEDGTVRVWDRDHEQPVAVFSDETIFNGVCWSDDSTALAVTDYRGRVHLLRLELPV